MKKFLRKFVVIAALLASFFVSTPAQAITPYNTLNYQYTITNWTHNQVTHKSNYYFEEGPWKLTIGVKCGSWYAASVYIEVRPDGKFFTTRIFCNYVWIYFNSYVH